MNDPLFLRLQTWVCRPPFDPAFAAGVRARLDGRGAASVAPMLFTPAFRLAMVACVLLAAAGGAGGGLALNQARANDRLAAAYARSIDPLQITASAGEGAHIHR